MENTPTLMTSEEQKAPWNDDSQNYVTKDVTVSVTYSKTIPMLFPKDDSAGEEYAEEQLREYNMLPLKESETDWQEDELAIIIE